MGGEGVSIALTSPGRGPDPAVGGEGRGGVSTAPTSPGRRPDPAVGGRGRDQQPVSLAGTHRGNHIPASLRQGWSEGRGNLTGRPTEGRGMMMMIWALGRRKRGEGEAPHGNASLRPGPARPKQAITI